ncbi:hypothetical protein Taro_022343 [Colocasia esculenta]|uniref:Uncharacterized protein n=1 Tax=Colocasia esculenta TaxID=4460 RepID=A0A843V1B4_COLES|nr:hypothetical protein [Colocasia esculenta]
MQIAMIVGVYICKSPFIENVTLEGDLFFFIFLQQIRFFHKLSSFSAPATDAEKLVWQVLEAERPDISQLHEKTLIEANQTFLEKHEVTHVDFFGDVSVSLFVDSLMHRAAVAEMLYVLEPEKKSEAIKLIEDSTNKPVSRDAALGPVKTWKLKDCIALHKLLESVFKDPDAASRWRTRCAEYFPYSTHFGGIHSSVIAKVNNQNICNMPENGRVNHHEADIVDPDSLNGKLETFKDLTI